MTIREFLQGKTVFNTKEVPSGKASTPQELYNDCITVQYPSEATNPKSDLITKAIIGWHELLSWYAKQDGAILLSRLYESKGTSGNWDNRRNSLTLSNNYNYAFCSNHFARVIMTMALNGFVPNKKDFWDMMVANREFYLGSLFGLTPIEKRISAFPINQYNCKFYTPGWYLAHIIPVKDMTFRGHDDVDVENIFKLGKESQWSMDSVLGCMVRRNDDTLNTKEQEVAVAHFLRCLDPINYFLVPNNNNAIYKKIHKDDGSPLGENKFVVQFMMVKAYERFGQVFKDFLELALADVDLVSICAKKSSLAAATINTEYGPGINKSGSALTYTDDDELKVVSYYLRNQVGLIEVEEIVLSVFDKRGFLAKRILNERGIDTSRNSVHRGLLIKSDIDDRISKATGLLKTTLEELKKRGL